MRSRDMGQFVLRRALWVAVLAAGIGCDRNPAAPSPLPNTPNTQAAPSVTSLAIGGTLSLHQPGDTGQLSATATFMDGTTKDVTHEAVWGSDLKTLTVSAGLVTAISFGSGEVVATYGAARQSVPARVAPAGAFLLNGKVTDDGHAVGEAKVEATSASGAYSTMTDLSGAFVVPGAGGVTLRVSKYGYDASVTQVTLDRDDQVAVGLRQQAQPGSIVGLYTLTFIASPSCALPPEAMSRTYRASIQEARNWHEPWDLDVTLDVAPLPTSWAEPGFIGRMDGATVRFTITDDVNGSYAFIEQVGPATLHFVGTAAATFSDRGIVATFDGSVVFRGMSVVECRAADHRLEFTR